MLKTRWKNLRDSYRKIVKNIDYGEKEDAKWAYFNAMDFLREITLGTASRPPLDEDPESISIMPDYTLTLQPKCTVDEALSDSEPARKRPAYKDNIKEEMLDMCYEIPRVEYETGQHDSYGDRGRPVDFDDDQHFLLSLHKYFKQVPMMKKLGLRMKIEQLIYEALEDSGGDMRLSASNTECP